MKKLIFIALLLQGLAACPLSAQCSHTGHNSSTDTAAEAIPLNSPDERIQLYPNPCRGVFYLSAIKVGEALEIYDSSGRLLFRRQADSNKYLADISTLGRSIYVYSITDNGSLVQRGRVVVE